jgi:hypothetical protein
MEGEVVVPHHRPTIAPTPWPRLEWHTATDQISGAHASHDDDNGNDDDVVGGATIGIARGLQHGDVGVVVPNVPQVHAPCFLPQPQPNALYDVRSPTSVAARDGGGGGGRRNQREGRRTATGARGDEIVEVVWMELH